MHEPWGIHWFRRDLRIPGNEGLKENFKQTQGRTLGLFCFDRKFLSRSDFSHHRFSFFLKTLKKLKEDLHAQGGDLLTVDAPADQVLPQLLAHLCSHKIRPPSLMTWNRDYEPFARQRDAHIEHLLKAQEIMIFQGRDHLLFEPHEIFPPDQPDKFYQVYTPFARKWFAKLASPEGQIRLKLQNKIFQYFEEKVPKNYHFRMHWSDIQQKNFPFFDALEAFEKINEKKVTLSIPPAGFFEGFCQLLKFKSKLQSYQKDRDYPASQGTSKISLFLKNGSLTVPQVLFSLGLENVTMKKEPCGKTQFVQELAWREFYYSILYHRPDVEKKCFLSRYDKIPWENNEKWFQRWKEGTTGFPIVDAGMRELASTGWMHNRVRMIVASFLTKDLLIDWRWGENHFMKELLDGDLAPNNGGWQWAASTGCDPQPYFRIFNPWLQSQKFDPQGQYIKKFVPELRDAPVQALHDPNADRTPWRYPTPMVQHAQQREKALSLFKKMILPSG